MGRKRETAVYCAVLENRLLHSAGDLGCYYFLVNSFRFPITEERMRYSLHMQFNIPSKKTDGPGLGHMSFPEAITMVRGDE